MRTLIARVRGDRGAALPMVAGMLVALLGLSALAVDLGWFYLNAARIQRTADAGALAGVIRMPDDFGQATVDANATTRANGYTDGIDSVDVLVEEVPSDPNQLDVTVTATVDTFFARILGFNDMTIRRRARGEFIPALKLGSPSNLFGNTCDPEISSGCGANFWANIHGKHTDTVMGDAFSSFCRGTSGNPGCTQNALFWRERGYLYGVDADGAGSFTVEFLDIAFHNNSSTFVTGDGWRTGDRGCEQWGNTDADCGPTMYVALYAPDPDPLDVSNNILICDAIIPPQPQVDETAGYVFSSPAGCFTVNGPEAGTYVVQVKVLDTGGNDDGLNRYSVRSSTGSLFGLGDFSIYNNASGSATEFYLAEVRDYYAGKTFVVELYDAGESSATGTLQVLDPSGAVFNDGACRIFDRTPPADWVLRSSPGNCQESVAPGEYNGRWLKFEMDIPSTYTCGGSCWWKMNYNYPSGVNDTTTWRAYIVGNPIHLVPNGG